MRKEKFRAGAGLMAIIIISFGLTMGCKSRLSGSEIRNADVAPTNISGTTDSQGVIIQAGGNFLKGTPNYANILMQPPTYSKDGHIIFGFNDAIRNFGGSFNISDGNPNMTQINIHNRAGDSTDYINLYIDSIVASSAGYPLLFKINGQLQLNNGTQANGNVLTSDANGNGSWQPLIAPSGATEPEKPVVGQFFLNTNTKKMEFWNGSAWAVINSNP